MSQVLSLSLSLFRMRPNVFSGTEMRYRMISCESVLGSTDAIRYVPLKVPTSVPNPTHKHLEATFIWDYKAEMETRVRDLDSSRT